MRPRLPIGAIFLALQYQYQTAAVAAKNVSTLPWGYRQSLLPRQVSVFDERPSDCPPCFNCNLDDFQCQQFAECGPSNGKCRCPEGFGGDDCGTPLCGSPVDGLDRAPRPTDQKYCQCSEGWDGINCNVCTDDQACNAMMPEGRDGVCYRGGVVQNQNYQFCDVTNQKINDMLDPRRPQVTFSCKAENQTCDFQFWVEHQESFYCALDTCSWDLQAQDDHNSTTYNCEHIQCRCIPGRFLCGEGGNLDLSGFIADSIKGPAMFKSIRYNDQSSDKNSFSEPNLDGLISQVFGDESIFLSCGSGECLYKTQVPGYERPIKVINTPLIAGLISGSALFIVVVGLIVAWLSRKKTTTGRYGLVVTDDDEDDEDDKEALMGDHDTAALHFSNISYRLGGKQILSGVQGMILPGELLAIMGPSGAGKTTLLDILAGKKKSGSVTKEIHVNGESIADDDFRNITGFVDQEDTMMPTLTVHETILDSALLRLPSNMSLAAKQRRVEEVERQLGIYHIRDSLIGSAEGQRGISGGEKRRVSIACELVTRPSIIFLDEPTSGLDTYNAQNVVDCLAELAKRSNRTIIFTIHQPRMSIVNRFSRFILLTEGRTVYSGPLSDSWKHFQSLGFTCQENQNIAEYLIDITTDVGDENSSYISKKNETADMKEDSEASKDSSWLEMSEQPNSPLSTRSNGEHDNNPMPQHTSSSVVEYLIEGYEKSPTAMALQKAIREAIANPVSNHGDSASSAKARSSPEKRIGLFAQFRILSRRTWRNLHRNPMLMLTHYATSVVLAVLLGYLFFGLTDDISGFQNRMGILSFVLALFGFSTLTSLTVFAEERLVFTRERANGYYHPFAYFAAKVLWDVVPLRLVPPVILSIIVYPMSGLVADGQHFVVFVLVLVLFNFAAAAVCLFVGIVVRNAGTANLLGSLFMLFSLLFSGLFLNHESIPTPALWLQMLSIFHYAFESLLVNEVRYLTLTEHKFGLDIEVPGASILSSFGFSVHALWVDVAGLCAFVAGFTVLSYGALHFLLVEKR